MMATQPPAMTTNDDGSVEVTITDEQLEDFERLAAVIKPRLDRATNAYSQAITSLWIGNAGAAIATLSFIGAAWHNDTFAKEFLLPLTLFILGLISMGIGSLGGLIRERRLIRNMEEANSIRDYWQSHPWDFRRRSEEAGLTLIDLRTRMACASAVLFVLGCAVGLIELWLH
jgi:hypothetical protein